MSIYHVRASENSGDGSLEHPFNGFAEAEAAAQPGDGFIVHEGTYPDYTFTKPGLPGQPISYAGVKAENVVVGTLTVAGDYIVLRDFNT